MTSRHDVHFSSASVDWYTPPWILDLARRIMGGIDLDPCSNDLFTTGATHAYTWRDNGLKRDWWGRVFINSPYGREISDWCAKYMEQYDSMEQCIQLLPARVDTIWFHSLQYDAVCFLKGRIRFVEGALLAVMIQLLGKDYVMKHCWHLATGDSAAFPSMLTYKGDADGIKRFQDQCEPHGLVLLR